jgi:sucrose phosphorylase
VILSGGHEEPTMKNEVQLIAYVDRFSGGGFREFQSLLEGPLSGLFGGVHVLPFFWPIDGADAGFDPIDHTQVDSRLGSWDDLRTLSERTEIMADLIVNHISSRSPQFADFRKRGEASPHAGMFLTYGRVFFGGAAEADLTSIIGPGQAFLLSKCAWMMALSIFCGPPSRLSKSTSMFAPSKAGAIWIRS